MRAFRGQGRHQAAPHPLSLLRNLFSPLGLGLGQVGQVMWSQGRAVQVSLLSSGRTGCLAASDLLYVSLHSKVCRY